MPKTYLNNLPTIEFPNLQFPRFGNCENLTIQDYRQFKIIGNFQVLEIQVLAIQDLATQDLEIMVRQFKILQFKTGLPNFENSKFGLPIIEDSRLQYSIFCLPNNENLTFGNFKI